MKLRRTIGTFGAAFVALSIVPVLAQDDEELDPEEVEAVMEEIVVTVDRSGDPVDVDALYLEQLRSQVIKDFDLAQEEQEKELWSQGLQTSVSAPGSRIAWGYDAQSEAAVRRSSMNDLPIDRVQPATVISVRS